MTRNSLRLDLLVVLGTLGAGCTSYQEIRISTVPEKADVYVNGVPLGPAPVKAKLITDAAGTNFEYRRHTIMARKDCYLDEKLTLQSPSRFWNNTKPFPEAITVKLRRDPRCRDARPGYSASVPSEASTLPEEASSRGGPRLREATGSGFVVSRGGHIVTNQHVVDGCGELRVAGGRAVLQASDFQSDLALLKLPTDLDLVLRFRDGRGIRAGEQVVVIGFPLQGLLASEPNVTTGAVSALAGLGDDRRYFQITAPVNPGSSGGPVLVPHPVSWTVDGANHAASWRSS